MAKIELSLRSNIELITASSLFQHKVQDSEMGVIIHRISKNFYAQHSYELGAIALSLWTASRNRPHTRQILVVAYELEHEWRAKHQSDAFILIASNPYSYDTISIAGLEALPSLTPLQAQLNQLKDEDYFRTPYWRAVNTAVLQHNGFECQVRIQGTQCGNTKDVEAVYLSLDSARGTEHTTYKNNMAVMCEECRIRKGMQVGAGVTHSHRVEVKRGI